jgi:two-component system chemotaxis response regulator CheB
MSKATYVIVVGASAGGIDPICEVMAQLDPDVNAAIFVILHLSNKAIGSFLKERIQRHAELPCQLAVNGGKIEAGNIYIAPPDYHLIVKESEMLITSGPPESRWRPSIDILFRSAAVAFRERAIGIILTGLLDDGTAGMIAIKKCGGTAIVQDPEEAQYPDMPLSVLQFQQVDYCIPLSGMGAAIRQTIMNKKISGVEVPGEVLAEAAIAERTASAINDTLAIGGNYSMFNCPDCGGGLWELTENGFNRYRCFIGHSYSEPELARIQTQKIESALWIAVRMMEEKRNLLVKMGENDQKKGLAKMSSDLKRRAVEFESYIKTIKQLLFGISENDAEPLIRDKSSTL